MWASSQVSPQGSGASALSPSSASWAGVTVRASKHLSLPAPLSTLKGLTLVHVVLTIDYIVVRMLTFSWCSSRATLLRRSLVLSQISQTIFTLILFKPDSQITFGWMRLLSLFSPFSSLTFWYPYTNIYWLRASHMSTTDLHQRGRHSEPTEEPTFKLFCPPPEAKL